MSVEVTTTTARRTAGTAASHPLRAALVPLAIDVALPIASYYLLSKSLGWSDLAALATSSAVPATRAVWALAAQRRFNPLATLMLVVNLAGVGLSLLSGDPRLMLAKDSGVSSVIGIAMLVSALAGRPLMSTALRPMFARGRTDRLARWDRMSATSPAFRRAERTYTLIWGVALLAECVARVIGAYTLPVDTMVWLGTLVLLAAMALALRLGHRLAIRPMRALLLAETH